MISLDKFKSDITKRSTTKSSRYIVEVFPPPIIADTDTSLLTFRCDSAELPGRTLLAAEHRTHGVVRKRPQNTVFADLNLTLICSSTFLEKKFFDHWQNAVQNMEDYRFEYYDDIIGTIHVTQLNEELQPIYKIELTESYPMLVAPMPLNWETSNDLQRVQITISYHKWTEMDATLDAPLVGEGAKERAKSIIDNKLSSTLAKISDFSL